MRRPIVGSKVVVTGASSGIGHALAQQLVRRGATVLATARRADRLEQLREQCHREHGGHGEIAVLAGDLTSEGDRNRIASWVQDNWGRCDVLINNAGSGAIGPFVAGDPERLRRIMDVNFFAPVELTRVLLSALQASSRPAVVLVGSVLALRGVPRKSEYCAAKFALRGWAEAIRVEFAAVGISVLQVHPSTTRSEFFDALIQTSPEEKSASVGSMSPDDVAAAIIRSLEVNRSETVLSPGGKALVWAAKRFPRTLDRVLARFG